MRDLQKSLNQKPPSEQLITHFSLSTIAFGTEALAKVCQEAVALHSRHLEDDSTCNGMCELIPEMENVLHDLREYLQKRTQ